ncbi:class I SAM-dependent methyltransferase [Neorhizobium sp. DT-125]|uniref:class I SAM-dependent methyltransferase n=1 Tax=Neorhizobium sp. DT-125 TaxID=3396163 RepID=UPI003F1D5FA2
MSPPFPATSMPDRDWWSALWPDPEGVLRRLGVEPDMTVLDLCCGDGYFTAALAKLVGGKVHALDLDPAMIEQAKAEVARQGTSVRRWICADAHAAAKLLAEPVDYVLMANTFHGVPGQPDLARTVRAVLQPQGLFGIVNWHPLPRERTTVLDKPRGPRTDMRMLPQAVSDVVEPEGFRTVRIIDLPPYHYAIVLETAP